MQVHAYIYPPHTHAHTYLEVCRCTHVRVRVCVCESIVLPALLVSSWRRATERHALKVAHKVNFPPLSILHLFLTHSLALVIVQPIQFSLSLLHFSAPLISSYQCSFFARISTGLPNIRLTLHNSGEARRTSIPIVCQSIRPFQASFQMPP